MKKEIFLDDLKETGVSILTKKYLEKDGQRYYVGGPHRQAYANNIFDIARLKKISVSHICHQFSKFGKIKCLHLRRHRGEHYKK